MKRLTLFTVFFLTLVACTTKGKTPYDDSQVKPDAFCEVIQEPTPLLMGAWQCSFTRYVGKSRPDENYVIYHLLKYDEQYALYFYRTWKRGRKKKTEWKNWTINGNEILGEARYGVKIFVQGEDVYFTIRGLEDPVKMSRGKD
jgi:hypothetical protein